VTGVGFRSPHVVPYYHSGDETSQAPLRPIQLSKLIVNIATGQVEDREDDGKDPVAVELGRRRG